MSRATRAPRAKPEFAYTFLSQYREQSALKFRSTKALDAAIAVLWKDDELYGLPRAHVGDNTMIVPTEAVPILKARGLQFKESRVLSAAELPPEEIDRLRREQGPY